MPYFESKGHNLYYNKTGSGSDILLIAGMGADHRDWALQRIFLKKHFRIISFDNRGIGKSHGKNMGITIEEMAWNVGDLLKFINTDTVHIVGHSMGAMIAMEYAIKNPDRVESLILSSLPDHNADGHSNVIINELNTILESGCQKNFIQKFLSYIFSSEYQKTEQFKTLSEFMFRSHRTYNLQTIHNQLRAIKNWSQPCEIDGLVRCPCLVVYGSEDKFISSSIKNSSLTGLFPNASFNVVRGGGHALHIEKAKEFNDMVLDFIKGSRNVRS